jgi:hypothetical protein
MSYDPKKWNDATHTRTFSNDGAGALSLFTVTGNVVVRVIPICTTIIASAAGANMELGVSADTDAMIASTLATDIDGNEIWVDATPTSPIEAESTSRDYIISNGDDIILTLDAQVDSGVIAFYCEWRALSSTGSVVAV